MPVVTAMEACFGLRPVAKAFGESFFYHIHSWFGYPGTPHLLIHDQMQLLVVDF